MVRVILPLAMLLALAVSGCANESKSTRASECEGFYILQSALADKELRAYAKEYFSSTARPVVLWDAMPGGSAGCNPDYAGLLFKRSTEVTMKGDDVYIGVAKMYFDEDAAFVTLLLRPTGMRADFLLTKKKGGWTVSRRSVGEVR